MTSAVERKPMTLPNYVPQKILDAANEEAKLRILAGYDDGYRAAAQLMRKMLADGWKPDRKSVEELCALIQNQPHGPGSLLDS